jgi:hypothetical protein
VRQEFSWQNRHCSINVTLDLLLTFRPWGGHFHFIKNAMQNKGCNLLKKNLNLIYLNVNKVLIIHFENILRIYLNMLGICYYFIAY